MKRLVFIIAMAAVCSLSFAQGDNSRKLSLTTKMFLRELNDGGFDPAKQEARRRARKAAMGPNALKLIEPQRRSKNDGRFYAMPDTINSRAYISAFITLEDNNDISELETLGVQVQCKFEKGIITSEIPVDKITDVAALSNVKKISVAEIMQPCTDLARMYTNTDDILTLSADALRAGINNKYDGKGVLLGIIDTGIDFKHIAFKDKDGVSRIVGAYIWNGVEEHEYSINQIAAATTDDDTDDHGTHTASTAGGSSVIIDGSNVTVTEDHANATYGGMAPGADLFLCGVKDLKSPYLANAFQKIFEYAHGRDIPVVISNSWSNNWGPHDGTIDDDNELKTILNSNLNDNTPSRICLFSSGNEANHSKDNEGGGNHILAHISSSNPTGTILRSNQYENVDGGYCYEGNLVDIWTRTPFSGSFNFNIYVLDSSNGKILATVPVTKWGEAVDISDYYDGELIAKYKNYDNKFRIALVAGAGENNRLISKKHEFKFLWEDYEYKESKYTLAFDISPVDGNPPIDVDMWGQHCYFTSHLQTSNHEWTEGSSDMSVGNQPTFDNVISVGAYVTRIAGYDYKGDEHKITDKAYTLGDIAPFSSYATEDKSPTGKFYPWITAPGALTISAVNSYHASGNYLKDNFNDKTYRVNSSRAYPYGTMQGTSMACPVVAGIVALWLQAAKEKGIQLTTSLVKKIMKETADHDDFTKGENAKRFGNGKINALKGINYILNSPAIEPSLTSLTFQGEIDETVEKTFHVRMTNVSDKVTVEARLHDPDGVFDIDKPIMVIGTEGVDVKVTWTPKAVGTYTATITLTSTDEDGMIADVVVNLKGTVLAPPALSVNTNRLAFTAKPNGVSTRQLTVQGYRLREDAVLFMGKSDGVFSINKTDIPAKYLDEPTTVTVSFSPKSTGNFTDTLTIVSGEATNKISLFGSAGDAGTLAKFEYWFDDETPGNHSITLNGTEDVIDSEIDTKALSVGVHQLHVRAIQTDGAYSYSPVSTTLFFKRPIGTANQIEYWFDDDRDNIGTVSGTLDGQKYEFISDLNLDDVTPGHHRLYCRAVSGDKKVVGAVTSVPVIVKSLYAGDATMASYSIVVDDKTVASGPLAPEKVVNFSYVLDASEMSLGTHQLKTTFWNSLGLSMTEQTPFKVVEVVKVIGDVNLDGAVDVADIASVISVMAGSAEVSSASADVNGDGAVDVADIATIIDEMAARARRQNDTEE